MVNKPKIIDLSLQLVYLDSVKVQATRLSRKVPENEPNLNFDFLTLS